MHHCDQLFLLTLAILNSIKHSFLQGKNKMYKEPESMKSCANYSVESSPESANILINFQSQSQELTKKAYHLGNPRAGNVRLECELFT